ncbi:MAG TPA: homoserine kinase [Bacteroidota bacterium]
MPFRRVKVYAPATVANLGSGFDVLGLAIDKPGDIVIAERTEKPGLAFSVRSANRDVPGDAKNNVAAHVALLLLQEFKPPFGIKMTLHKKMPIGSGLGSSAASSVASVVAVNALLDKPLKKIDLLRFAVEGERKASGAPHADNAAPSLLGGACLIRSYEPLDVVSIPIVNSIFWVVVHPHVIVRTEDARSILPKAVTLQTATRQWGNISGLTIGLATGNVALVGKCVEDQIAEPVRANLIPGFNDVKQAAIAAGAYGCSISGSGPSMFAVADSERSARAIGSAMKKTFATAAGVACEVYVSRINKTGAKILPVR